MNPVVRAVLRSPVHDLLSARTLLVGYRGRRSGRPFAVPANYVERPDGLTLVSRRRRVWWRNFIAPAPVVVTLRGLDRRGRAIVLDADAGEVADAVATLYETAGHPLTPERAAARAEDCVLVDVELERIHDLPAPPLRGRALWRRWTLTVTVGATAGFAVAAVAGALVAAAAVPFAIAAPVILAAGAVEGAILGLSQAVAVRAALPELATRRWVAATVKGALVAWTIGLVPLAVDVSELSAATAVTLGVPLGLVLVGAVGAFQSVVLDGHAARPRRWIPATAAAWGAGLAVMMAVASPLWQEGQAVAWTALTGVVGGVAMAFTVAALTGIALERMLR